MFPIIQTSASKCTVIHSKACHSNDVEGGVGRCTKSGDVSGIRRDLGFDKRDMHTTLDTNPLGRRMTNRSVASFLSG